MPNILPFKTEITQKLSLSVLSGIMLAISYPGLNLYYFEWIAFVPLILAIQNTNLRTCYILATITGFFGVVIGFHWFGNWAEIALEIPFPLSYIATLGYSFAVAQVFGIIFTVFQVIKNKFPKIDILVLPIVFVAIFSAAPIIFKFSLGDAQSYFLIAVQAIEFTGVYGLDSIIILTNIIIYKLIFDRQNIPNRFLLTGALLIIVIWFGVGLIRLNNWDKKIARWDKKRIGLVQPNRKATLKHAKSKHPYSRTFPKEIALSQKLLSDYPDVIIWPEGQNFGYSTLVKVQDAFRSQISRMQVPLVFHDITWVLKNNQKGFYNSTLWLDKDGQFSDQYNKIIRVPFGEYTPFTENIPFIKDILGNFLINLSKGDERKAFPIAGMKLVPVICYESLFPAFVAESIQGSPAGKVIVIQSQDGWYGKSSASEQHLTSSVLRAIENRVPLIHVINNGRSAIALPNGKYVFVSTFFKEGQWVVEMPFRKASGGSFYSKFPYLYIYCIRFCFALIIFGYWLNSRKSKRIINKKV